MSKGSKPAVVAAAQALACLPLVAFASVKSIMYIRLWREDGLRFAWEQMWADLPGWLMWLSVSLLAFFAAALAARVIRSKTPGADLSNADPLDRRRGVSKVRR